MTHKSRFKHKAFSLKSRLRWPFPSLWLSIQPLSASSQCPVSEQDFLLWLWQWEYCCKMGRETERERGVLREVLKNKFKQVVAAERGSACQPNWDRWVEELLYEQRIISITGAENCLNLKEHVFAVKVVKVILRLKLLIGPESFQLFADRNHSTVQWEHCKMCGTQCVFKKRKRTHLVSIMFGKAQYIYIPPRKSTQLLTVRLSTAATTDSHTGWVFKDGQEGPITFPPRSATKALATI